MLLNKNSIHTNILFPFKINWNGIQIKIGISMSKWTTTFEGFPCKFNFKDISGEKPTQPPNSRILQKVDQKVHMWDLHVR